MVRRSTRHYVLLYVSLLALLLVLAACGGRGEASRLTLTVTKAGTGGGTVMGTDLNCGDDCTGSYATGTTVTLTVTPDSGSVFTGWSGDCSGESCELSMDSDKAVTATFDVEPPAPQGKELSGTAEGWTGQDAVLRAETYGENGEDYIVVATSPISEDGSFSLSLPGAEEMGNATSSITVDDANCRRGDNAGTGRLEITPSQFETAFVELAVFPASSPDGSEEDRLGHFSLEDFDEDDLSEYVYVQQLYASTDATIQGSCTFTYKHEHPDTGELVDFTDTGNYDVSLVAGWNNFIVKFEELGATSLSFTFTTGALPEGVIWRYYEGAICDTEVCEVPPAPCEDPDEPGCEPAEASSTSLKLQQLLLPRIHR